MGDVTGGTSSVHPSSSLSSLSGSLGGGGGGGGSVGGMVSSSLGGGGFHASIITDRKHSSPLGFVVPYRAASEVTAEGNGMSGSTNPQRVNYLRNLVIAPATVPTNQVEEIAVEEEPIEVIPMKLKTRKSNVNKE